MFRFKRLQFTNAVFYLLYRRICAIYFIWIFSRVDFLTGRIQTIRMVFDIDSIRILYDFRLF